MKKTLITLIILTLATTLFALPGFTPFIPDTAGEPDSPVTPAPTPEAVTDTPTATPAGTAPAGNATSAPQGTQGDSGFAVDDTVDDDEDS